MTTTTTQETEHERFDATVRGLVSDLEGLVAIATGYGDDLTEDDWHLLEGFGIVDASDFPELDEDQCPNCKEDMTGQATHQRATDLEGGTRWTCEFADRELPHDEMRDAVREHLYEMPLAITEHATRSPGDEWEHSHSVILFATGGPGIELNTQTMLMEGYWWGDRVSIPCNSTVADFYIGDTY